MWRKFLCFVGWHRWEQDYLGFSYSRVRRLRHCLVCDKKQCQFFMDFTYTNVSEDFYKKAKE